MENRRSGAKLWTFEVYKLCSMNHKHLPSSTVVYSINFIRKVTPFLKSYHTLVACNNKINDVQNNNMSMTRVCHVYYIVGELYTL